jgi:prepilin-type N-terminal cleavage/methylation domain-containing protein
VFIKKSKLGFTLIELIIVMVIFAIMAAVSIPRLGSLFDAKSFRLTINKAIAFLRDARMDALSTGKSVSVVVNLEDGMLWRPTDIEDDDEEKLQMPEGIEMWVEEVSIFKDEVVEFAFYPNGTASGPRLFMRSTGRGKSAVIYLEPLAGLIRYKVSTIAKEKED